MGQAIPTKSEKSTSNTWAYHSERVNEIIRCSNHIKSVELHLGVKFGPNKKEV